MKRQDGALILKRSELRALLAHASKDTTREALCSLLVDVERGVVVATDGHRLALLGHEDWPLASWTLQDLGTIPSPSAVIVPRAPLEAASKACPPKGCVVLRADGPRVIVEMHATDLPLGAPMSSSQPLRVEVAFPAISQVMPSHAFEAVEEGKDDRGCDHADAPARRAARRVGYTPRYLVDALDFVGTQESWNDAAVLHTPTDPHNPLVVRMGRALALIMPKRT